MRTTAPQLLPLFRSDGQGRLLARVYLGADRPATLADLSRELEIDDGGLTREADRLERAGLVRSERVGRSRILRPNEESPYYRDLYGLLLKAFGPATVIGPELAQIEGIERAYLFGSWAARYVGEEGPDPADIDVVAVGGPSQLAVARAERELSEQLGREVNVTIVARDAWEAAESGFLQQVRESPLVPLHLDTEERPA
jgi:predicted nucleotidyltransferase